MAKLQTECPICKSKFDKWGAKGKSKSKYCSKACRSIVFKSQKGYWKGKKIPQEVKDKMSKWHTENKIFWKGDDVGYYGVHTWIVKDYGKASKCEHCGGIKSKKFHWSNKYHTYRRRREDWQELCASCHKIYDINVLGCKH